MDAPKAIWNPARDVWETESIDLLSEHSDVFSETWPTSGMTRSGLAYELPTPALRMGGSASSFLPTPQAHDAQKGKTAEQVAAMRARGHGVWNLNEVAENELRFKTPTAQLAVNGGSQHPDKRKAGGHGPTLADEVEHLLPTPTTKDANASGGSNPSNVTLTDAIVRTSLGAITNPRFGSGNQSPDVTLPPPLLEVG